MEKKIREGKIRKKRDVTTVHERYKRRENQRTQNKNLNHHNAVVL